MKYKVAETRTDYTEVYNLMRSMAQPMQEVCFPTIMAFDGETLVGFVATTPRTDMVLAGPMVMRDDKKRVFTAKRLIELYENVMRSIGIKTLIFYADEKDNLLIRAIQKWFPKVHPYAKQGTHLFYNWRLDSEERV